MNDTNEPELYHKAAIFTCTCCAYTTTIYSDIEWLAVTEKLSCEICEGTWNGNVDVGLIYREDITDETPFQLQFATLPPGKYHCDHFIYPKQLHWAKLIVHCCECNKDAMLFTAYCVGKNILNFYELCKENTKPEHPSILWESNNGDEIYVISGWGAGFSST
jgi:hypothetical protein